MSGGNNSPPMGAGMYRINHPTHFSALDCTFSTIEDAIRAFVDAGCPTDRVDGRCQGAWVYDVAGKERTVSLFPRLPDVSAGLSRAEIRAGVLAGTLRGWTYPAWWSAWLAVRAA